MWRKTAREWTVQYSRDGGFELVVMEVNALGVMASRVMYLLDPCKSDATGWASRLLPCWINPYGWTWKIGPEGKSLGDRWMDVGQQLCRFADGLRRERTLHVIPLTVDVVKRRFPDTWESFGFLVEDEDDE